MVEIDRQICLDKSDACKIEQKYIEELQADMNTRFAIRSKTQYRIDNKDIIALKDKKYYSENKDKISERQKLYNLENKEHIYEQQKLYNLENKEHISEQKKLYYIENKEHITKYKHEWYLENRERYSEIKNQSFDCPCGKHYTYRNRSRHFKSPPHLAYLTTINNIDIIQNGTPN